MASAIGKVRSVLKDVVPNEMQDIGRPSVFPYHTNTLEYTLNCKANTREFEILLEMLLESVPSRSSRIHLNPLSFLSSPQQCSLINPNIYEPLRLN